MANIVIVHGTYGSPDENWFPWLKKELELLGHNVYVPSFPTPKDQSLKSWMDVFEEFKGYLDEESVVVGHSLGPAFLLSVLEIIKTPIKAAFFVSGFTGFLGNSEFDELNRTFVVREFNWSKIRENCGMFVVIHSDNDPYVPLQKGEDLAKNLDSKLLVLKGAGHFNISSGYTSFEFLLDRIKEVL